MQKLVNLGSKRTLKMLNIPMEIKYMKERELIKAETFPENKIPQRWDQAGKSML